MRGTRDVYVTESVDGIATLIARLDTLTAHSIRNAIDAHLDDATVPAEPGSTIGERRAEVLAALVLGPPALCDAAASGARAVSVNLDVTVPLADLIAQDDGVGLLPDGAAVGFELLRSMLDDPAVVCTMRPIVVDAGGHVLDVGRRRYPVTGALRRLIIARDRTCRFPGCGRAAGRGEIDHARAWEDGGGTCVANLGALCTRHHQLKTLAGWDIVDSRPDGSCTWRSPHGRTYDHGPPPY
jgi:hypothetical protein